MTKLRNLLFLLLFCIFQKREIIDGAELAKRKLDNSNVCSTPECKDAASIILHSIDTKVDPCDNFYKFACGNFTKSTVIPKGETYIDRQSILEQKVKEQLKTSLEETSQPNEPRSTTLAKNFYNACVNTAAIEKNGLHTILGKFKKVGGWPVLAGDSWQEKNFDWEQSVYDMQKVGYQKNYLFQFKIIADPANSTKRVLNIDQPNVLFSDREYLIKGYNNITKVKAYYNYMVDIAVMFGASKGKAEQELKESLKFEIKLANLTMNPDDRSNPAAFNNRMTVKELSAKYPSIHWKKFMNSLLKPFWVIDDNEVIIVSVPIFFEKFEKLIKETQKRVLANFLLWNAIQESIPLLTDEIRKRDTKYRAERYSGFVTPARWKDCLMWTSLMCIESVSSLYVRQYFRPKAKKNAEELAVNIQNQLKKILTEAKWLDEKTRSSAVDKLASMKIFIGYPDELLDTKIIDDYLNDLEITRNDFLQAYLSMRIFWINFFTRQLREPINKSNWTDHSGSVLVTTEHHDEANSIDIFAGILQGILFGKYEPQYLNYGGIGSFTIGMEITKAFDNVGRKYDKDGNLKNWWTPETEKKFLQKADCIINQYGNYTVEEVGLKVNAILTERDNIASNGGLKISYLAYQDWAKRNSPQPKLPGLNYSSSQLFWIQAAVQQCGKTTPEFMKEDMATDEISPYEFRVIGAFSNRPESAKDFNCPLGSKMNPVNKCSVW